MLICSMYVVYINKITKDSMKKIDFKTYLLVVYFCQYLLAVSVHRRSFSAQK